MRPFSVSMFVFVLLAATGAGGLAAGDPGRSLQETAPQGSLDDRVAALEKEFSDAQQALFKKLGELSSDEERSKHYLANKPDPSKYAPRFFALAEEAPKSDAAARALAWAAGNASESGEGRKALEWLVLDHADNDRLADVCFSMQYAEGEHVDPALEKLVGASKNEKVRASALYALAKREIERSPNGAAAPQAEERLERVATDFPTVEVQGRKLGDLARGDLFELRELGVGKVAPEIEGEDVDGVKFKLSDYRGKVVVLDFWGNW